MLDPNYLLNITRRAERRAADLHDSIMYQMIKRFLARALEDEFGLTGTDIAQLKTLKAAGYLYEDIQKEIAKALKLTKEEVKKAFEDAGLRAMEADDEIYRQAGIPTTALSQSPDQIRIMQRDYEATMGSIQNFTQTTAEEAQRAFIQACDRAYTRVLSGSESFSQAVLEELQRILDEDVVVSYPSGHTDSIEVAIARAVRTGISQATSDITATRAAENGVTCFLVSSHIGARPTHEVWQGKVYWVDWERLANTPFVHIPHMDYFPIATYEEKAKYKEFCETTQIGTVTGLCGANCRHSYGPWFEGISENHNDQFDTEENRRIYELSQRQRAKERKIRKLKRQVEGLRQAEANGIETDLVNVEAQLRDALTDYYSFCSENGLRAEEIRLAI